MTKAQDFDSFTTVNEIQSLFYMQGPDVYWHPRPAWQFKRPQDCKMWNTSWANQIAGRIKSNGYRSISLHGFTFLAHRIAWILHHNEFPPADLHIDHINRIKSDNTIENLRLVTHSQNQVNKGLIGNNQSGFKGVTKSNTAGKYVAHIRKDKHLKYLGTFPDPETAALAYDAAAILHHGQYAVTNQSLGLL